MLRILTTGSRTWTDTEAINDQFTLVAHQFADHDWVVVHGDCKKGADLLVDLWCQAHGMKREPHPANWGKDGRKAGLVRNMEMIEAGADICLAFLGPCGKTGCRKGPHPHPSHGTEHCRHEAVKAGIPTWTIRRGGV